MGAYVLPGNPPIQLNLRRSARARRITLRVSGLNGRVTLTLPRGVPEKDALAFAREKEPWLRRHLSKLPDPMHIAPGATIPILGAPHALVPCAGRGVVRKDGALHLRFDDGQAAPRLRAWLKTQARQALVSACDHYASQLGRPYTSLTLRDTRSRWGSCTSRGGLNFSWRLVMAPEFVLNYVAAHEVAHLAQMNHSPAFWAHVADLYGPHDGARQWLKTEGAALHALDFTEAARPLA